MHNKPFMDHKIGDHTYRVGRLSSFDGAFIMSVLTTAMAAEYKRRAAAGLSAQVVGPPQDAKEDVPVISREDGLRQTANFLITQLNRSHLREVMGICLSATFRYEYVAGATAPMPILMDATGDRFAIAELENDAPVCLELVRLSLAFNIASFGTAGE